MKLNIFSSPFLIATLSLLPLAAFAETISPAKAVPKPPAKSETPLQQAKAVSQGMMDAMESMASALENTKDEKSAKIAADEILSTTAKLQKLAKSGRELKSKLTDKDKLVLEKTVNEAAMAQYKERFTKAFAAIAEKPEILEILRPAMASFGAAAMAMAAEVDDSPPIDAEDKKSSNVE